MSRRHILIAVGARPNFMKAAPLVRALKATARFQLTLVHTGQHYDRELSSFFFRDLGLPRPDVNLKVGSLSPAQQVERIVSRFESVLVRRRPDLVVVVGDVNSTLACAAAAARAIPRPLVAHVEAGLRSFDVTMPEEANRIFTDHLSDLLFAPSRDAALQLRREGIPPQRIFFVGNVMIDSLRYILRQAGASPILRRLKLSPRGYALVTLHRPSNVENRSRAQGILRTLEWLAGRLPIVFPMHPRTRKGWGRLGFLKGIDGKSGMRVIPPLGYRDFVSLMASARLVLTDSGGIQEETTVLRVPCLTLRKNTERPLTVRVGTNRLVGTDPGRIVRACQGILKGQGLEAKIPPYWDGRAATRITRVLLKCL